MAQVEKTVFISYRRSNSFMALAVYQNLTKHGYDVFFDFNSIDSGDFEQVILGNIKSRAHFILILTPSALERCHEPGDWIRREIEVALDTQRNIVPLMFEGFDYNSLSIERHLTGKLALLKNYNAQRVPADFFEEAMTRVRERFLNIPLEMVFHPRPREADEAAYSAREEANKEAEITGKALSAEEWNEKGVSLDDNSDEEIACYTEAIHLKPDFHAAYNNRGLAYNQVGQYNQAIADFTEAIRLKPDYQEAYNNRGLAYDNRGNSDQAIADYSEAIRLRPSFHMAYNNRGLVYHAQGNYDQAIADYATAIRFQPNFYDAYNNRGAAFDDKGEFNDAIADYSAAIRLKPNFHTAYNNRGFSHKQVGQYEQAIADFTEAIRLKPDYPNPYRHIGSVHYLRGDYIAARAYFEKALRLDPDYAEAREDLLRVKEKLGEA